MRDMMLISFIHLFQVFGFDLGTFNVSKASRMGRQVIPWNSTNDLDSDMSIVSMMINSLKDLRKGACAQLFDEFVYALRTEERGRTSIQENLIRHKLKMTTRILLIIRLGTLWIGAVTHSSGGMVMVGVMATSVGRRVVVVAVISKGDLLLVDRWKILVCWIITTTSTMIATISRIVRAVVVVVTTAWGVIMMRGGLWIPVRRQMSRQLSRGMPPEPGFVVRATGGFVWAMSTERGIKSERRNHTIYCLLEKRDPNKIENASAATLRTKDCRSLWHKGRNASVQQ